MYAQPSTTRMLRKSMTNNECGDNHLSHLAQTQAIVKLHQEHVGPPPLLKQPLEGYFNDRVEERIDLDPSLAEQKAQHFPYSVASEEIAAKKEISCLDNKLQEARTGWGILQESMNARWAEANRKQEELYKSIPLFNQYYKDHFTRRERAGRQLSQEQEQIRIREGQNRKKRKEVDSLTEVREETASRLEKFEIFKSYLHKALALGEGQFGKVEELIDRYNDLAKEREALTNETEEAREMVEKKQKELDNECLIKSTEILIYRNYLSEILEYDTILQEKVFWLQDGLERIKITAAQRTMIIGQIKMAIHNLYRQICTVLHRNPNIKLDDPLGQLADIRISVIEIAKLSHDIRRMLKAAHLSHKEEEEAKARIEKIQLEKQRKLDKLMNKTPLKHVNVSHRKSQQINDVSKVFYPPK